MESIPGLKVESIAMMQVQTRFGIYFVIMMLMSVHLPLKMKINTYKLLYLIIYCRFDACKLICNKRNPPAKSPVSNGGFQRNPKHTSILQDCGINYDKPLHPMMVNFFKFCINNYHYHI